MLFARFIRLLLEDLINRCGYKGSEIRPLLVQLAFEQRYLAELGSNFLKRRLKLDAKLYPKDYLAGCTESHPLLKDINLTLKVEQSCVKRREAILDIFDKSKNLDSVNKKVNFYNKTIQTFSIPIGKFVAQREVPSTLTVVPKRKKGKSSQTDLESDSDSGDEASVVQSDNLIAEEDQASVTPVEELSNQVEGVFESEEAEDKSTEGKEKEEEDEFCLWTYINLTKP